MRRLSSPHSSNTKCMKSEIKLFGTKYKIKLIDRPIPLNVDENDDGNYAYGQARHTEFEIQLPVKTVEGKRIPKYDLEKNLCHEIAHCILAEGGYLNNNNDEPLVEWIARCVYSIFVKQNIFEL